MQHVCVWLVMMIGKNVRTSLVKKEGERCLFSLTPHPCKESLKGKSGIRAGKERKASPGSACNKKPTAICEPPTAAPTIPPSSHNTSKRRG